MRANESDTWLAKMRANESDTWLAKMLTEGIYEREKDYECGCIFSSFFLMLAFRVFELKTHTKFE